MSASPAVTVMMGAYNAAPYIGMAIESILNQSFTDFEFIIVDDGSTDETGALIDHYAARDSRIIALHQDNQGNACALNRALALAKGALVANMDADDIALPNRLAAQHAYLNAYPDVGVLGTSMRAIAPDGTPGRDMINGPDAVRAGLAHPTMMVRKDVALAVGGYRALFTPAHDYDFWMHVADRYPAHNLTDIHVLYRQHDKSYSTALALQQSLSACIVELVAAERRAGRTDPTDGLSAITFETLRLFSLSPKTMNRMLARVYQGDLCAFLERGDVTGLAQRLDHVCQTASTDFWNRSVLVYMLVWLTRNVAKRKGKQAARPFLARLFRISPLRGLEVAIKLLKA
jgi:glycosyltransferase involved in cell wall biosynthesis